MAKYRDVRKPLGLLVALVALMSLVLVAPPAVADTPYSCTYGATTYTCPYYEGAVGQFPCSQGTQVVGGSCFWLKGTEQPPFTITVNDLTGRPVAFTYEFLVWDPRGGWAQTSTGTVCEGTATSGWLPNQPTHLEVRLGVLDSTAVWGCSVFNGEFANPGTIGTITVSFAGA